MPDAHVSTAEARAARLRELVDGGEDAGRLRALLGGEPLAGPAGPDLPADGGVSRTLLPVGPASGGPGNLSRGGTEAATGGGPGAGSVPAAGDGGAAAGRDDGRG